MDDIKDFVRAMAAKRLAAQEKEPPLPGSPPDYYGSDTLRYCGRCRTPRQAWIKGPDDKPMLVPIDCKCREEEFKRRDAEEKARRDMEIISRLRSDSLMDDKFRESTFQTFKATKENRRNLQLCRRYAEGFDEMLEKNQGLLFWGNVGTGKTFAAACVANYLLERKVPTVMTSFVKIMDSTGTKDALGDLLNRLNHAKLLIIDDLGAERGTDFALERVYNIIDSRYRARLPMILTTNLTRDEMIHCTDIRYARIYDRIFEVCYPMEFKGTSWRKAEASRRFEAMERLLEGTT